MKKIPYYIALYQDEKIIINAKINLLKEELFNEFHFLKNLQRMYKKEGLGAIHGFMEIVYLNFNRNCEARVNLKQKTFSGDKCLTSKMKSFIHHKRVSKNNKKFILNLNGLEIHMDSFLRAVTIHPSSEFYGQINFKKVIGGLVSKKHLRYLSSLTEILY